MASWKVSYLKVLLNPSWRNWLLLVLILLNWRLEIKFSLGSRVEYRWALRTLRGSILFLEILKRLLLMVWSYWSLRPFLNKRSNCLIISSVMPSGSIWSLYWSKLRRCDFIPFLNMRSYRTNITSKSALAGYAPVSLGPEVLLDSSEHFASYLHSFFKIHVFTGSNR